MSNSLQFMLRRRSNCGKRLSDLLEIGDLSDWGCTAKQLISQKGNQWKKPNDLTVNHHGFMCHCDKITYCILTPLKLKIVLSLFCSDLSTSIDRSSSFQPWPCYVYSANQRASLSSFCLRSYLPILEVFGFFVRVAWCFANLYFRCHSGKLALINTARWTLGVMCMLNNLVHFWVSDWR